MILPYINMNPPQVYTCPHPEPPSLLPPHTIPLGCPSAPAPSIQYHALNLDRQLVKSGNFISIITINCSYHFLSTHNMLS